MGNELKGKSANAANATRTPPAQAALQPILQTLKLSKDAVLITEAEPINEPGPRIVWVNRAFEEMTGYSAAEIVGNTPRVLQGPKSDRAALDRIRQALENWLPVREELLNYRKDGSEFYVDLSILPVADETGWYTHWISLQRETTAQNQLRSRAEASEQKLRLLLESLPHLVWTADAHGVCDFVSQSCCTYFGASAEDSRNWSRFVHPDDLATAYHTWQKAVSTGTPFDCDFRFRRYDGAYEWFHNLALPRLDPHGNVLQWVGTSSNVSDRKRLLSTLQERERELDEAHRIAKLGAWRYHVAEDQPKWSREMFHIFGLDPLGPAPTSAQWRPHFTEESWRRISQAVAAAATAGTPWDLELNVVRPDGAHRIVICRGEVAERAAEKVTLLRGTAIDVTELREAQAKLAYNQRFLQKFFESDIIGIALPHRDGGFSDGNDEFLRMTGYSRDDLRAGWVRWDLMTPAEYADLDATHIAEAARRGSCTPYAKEYIRKDGSRIPVLVGYALLPDSQDEYVAFILDISEQKHAEIAMQEREHRFRTLAESLPQMIFTAGPHGEKTYVNQKYLEFTGARSPQQVGETWADLVEPQQRESVARIWQQSLASGSPYLAEYRMRRYDGTFRHVLARAIPVKREDGQVEQWIGTLTDVHDQKLTEEAMRRSEKLAIAGRLAASIAHEVNNPLMSVSNILYIARGDKSLSPATQEYLRLAERELTRAVHFTTQSLRFHRQASSPNTTDLSQLMDSVLQVFEPRFDAALVAVRRDYQPDCNLYCYADELRQVFASFLSNSLDACSRGDRVRLRIRSAHSWRNPAESGVRITISDSGCGIPVTVRKRIFEPFTTTKEATGTGLGLWVSADIVRKHNGTITFRSSVAKTRGTTFTLFLPFSGIVE